MRSDWNMRGFHPVDNALDSKMVMVVYLLNSHLGTCAFTIESGCRVSFSW